MIVPPKEYAITVFYCSIFAYDVGRGKLADRQKTLKAQDFPPAPNE